MTLETQFFLKSNEQYLNYLRTHSYWYKNLNRNPDLIEVLTDEMKEKYKLTTADKINNLGQKLELISTFINVLK